MKTRLCAAQPAFKKLYFRCRYGGLKPTDIKELIKAVLECGISEVKCNSKRCEAGFLEFSDLNKNGGED